MTTFPTPSGAVPSATPTEGPALSLEERLWRSQRRWRIVSLVAIVLAAAAFMRPWTSYDVLRAERIVVGPPGGLHSIEMEAGEYGAGIRFATSGREPIIKLSSSLSNGGRIEVNYIERVRSKRSVVLDAQRAHIGLRAGFHSAPVELSAYPLPRFDFPVPNGDGGLALSVEPHRGYVRTEFFGSKNAPYEFYRPWQGLHGEHMPDWAQTRARDREEEAVDAPPEPLIGPPPVLVPATERGREEKAETDPRPTVR